jgi:hypothetical protein
MAQRFRSGEAQGVADWLKSYGQVNAEDFWSLFWYDPSVKSVPITKQERWHYFPDHDVVYWRSDWGPNATAFAFKCGPPEGHQTAELLTRFPDWRLSSGHAHPDANSYIIFSKGQYLTGDSGYAGVPMTEHHNTVLVNGKGQGREGSGHDAFDGIPYDQLNRIRIVRANLSAGSVTIVGDATAAYEPNLGVNRFLRTFTFSPAIGFEVSDSIATSKPEVITSLVHADNRIEKVKPNQFVINSNGVKLSINVVQPQDDRTAINKNILTAPGRPGSVDKGERQERGEKLAISTPTPATQAQFSLKFRVL